MVEQGSLDELRHLTRTTLYVETKEDLDDLGKRRGVHDLKVSGAGMTFQADRDELGSIMKAVSEKGLVKIESSPPTLEDLFMRHYEGEEG
jgi:ABC-2 type transport system ATP-binding protein